MKNPKFVLKNVSFDFIDVKYKFNTNGNTSDKLANIYSVHTKTKISNISKEVKNNFSFIDEAKNERYCLMTMKNINNINKNPSCSCFWCRHPFEYKPLGCPIDYINDKVYKEYYSEITKNNYCLQETITKNQLENVKDIKNDDFTLKHSPQNFYLVDGIFCSFNCCYAFILEQKNNPLYNKSAMYLKKMYYDLFQYDNDLEPAPSWRLLQSYGGDLSIADFRKNFYKIDYNEFNEHIRPNINWKNIGMLFEKTVKI